jgi:hypothetical protein
MQRDLGGKSSASRRAEASQRAQVHAA